VGSNPISSTTFKRSCTPISTRATMQPGTTCWGRKAEVAKVLDVIRDSPRSAVLLFGDSGIGKFTLIKEVAHMLEHKSLVSAAATAGAEGILRRFLRGHAIRQRSPLLRSLDNLLRQIYSVGGIRNRPVLIGRSCRRVCR
jgi:hypothetical protein